MLKKKNKLEEKKIEKEEVVLNIDNIEKLFMDLLDYFTNIEKTTLNMVHRGKMTKEELENRSYKYLELKGCTLEIAKEVVKKFKTYIWGYNIIDPLINNPDISDINIMAYNNIRIKKLGKRYNTDIKFKDNNEYISFVNYIAVKNKVSISDLNAVQTFVDKDSNPDFILRIEIMTQFIMDSGFPSIQIRKHSRKKLTMADLQERKMFNEETKKYLLNIIKSGKSILVTGKGAVGKTTLMNAMLDEYPFDKRGLVIQENSELHSEIHPELLFQHIVTNRGEGKINYGLKNLCENGLRIDLDLFVIGEIKGDEALYYLMASDSGHTSWASIHSPSSEEALDKITDYIKYNSDYSKQEIMQMLKHIDVIIFLNDFQIKEISEVKGWDKENNKIIYNTTYFK